MLSILGVMYVQWCGSNFFLTKRFVLIVYDRMYRRLEEGRSCYLNCICAVLEGDKAETVGEVCKLAVASGGHSGKFRRSFQSVAVAFMSQIPGTMCKVKNSKLNCVLWTCGTWLPGVLLSSRPFPISFFIEKLTLLQSASLCPNFTYCPRKMPSVILLHTAFVVCLILIPRVLMTFSYSLFRRPRCI